MKVGIYVNNVSPNAGGASTLTRTIIKEIKERMDEYTGYSFVLLSRVGKKADRKMVIDGIEAINVDYRLNIIDKIRLKTNFAFDTDFGGKEFDRIAREEGIDIIWFCNPLPAQVSTPYIFTVWDLGHRTVPFFPEVSSDHNWKYREHLFSRMISGASWILTGNETGKKEILENYSVPENRIRIAPFPISSFCFEEEQKPSFDLPETYFFYPAQFWPHKNHAAILYALKELKETHHITPAVFFTGSDKGNKSYIESLAKQLDVSEQVTFTGFLSDAELKYMYTHAAAMIFASLMGPNNLPPIESTYLGCPVIISNLPGHVEQLGDSALYFKGTDESELADCILRIMKDDERVKVLEKQKTYRSSFVNMKYIDPVLDILREFEGYRRCWK